MFFCFVLSSARRVSQTTRGHQLVVVARHHLAYAHLVFPMHVAPPEVLVGTAVASLARGHAITVASEVLQVVLVQHRFVFHSATNHTVSIVCGLALVEVLRRAGRLKH